MSLSDLAKVVIKSGERTYHLRRESHKSTIKQLLRELSPAALRQPVPGYGDASVALLAARYTDVDIVLCIVERGKLNVNAEYADGECLVDSYRTNPEAIRELMGVGCFHPQDRPLPIAVTARQPAADDAGTVESAWDRRRDEVLTRHAVDRQNIHTSLTNRLLADLLSEARSTVGRFRIPATNKKNFYCPLSLGDRTCFRTGACPVAGVDDVRQMEIRKYLLHGLADELFAENRCIWQNVAAEVGCTDMLRFWLDKILTHLHSSVLLPCRGIATEVDDALQLFVRSCLWCDPSCEREEQVMEQVEILEASVMAAGVSCWSHFSKHMKPAWMTYVEQKCGPLQWQSSALARKIHRVRHRFWKVWSSFVGQEHCWVLELCWGTIVCAGLVEVTVPVLADDAMERQAREGEAREQLAMALEDPCASRDLEEPGGIIRLLTGLPCDIALDWLSYQEDKQRGLLDEFFLACMGSVFDMRNVKKVFRRKQDESNTLPSKQYCHGLVAFLRCLGTGVDMKELSDVWAKCLAQDLLAPMRAVSGKNASCSCSEAEATKRRTGRARDHDFFPFAKSCSVCENYLDRRFLVKMMQLLYIHTLGHAVCDSECAVQGLGPSETDPPRTQ
eukprot:TRINITY_DN100813_c0_g1_i1.p1 TRINITY_DN100813_c0_g1~~TRINITY_DN100813_c0_g1_i1.p1  ORF type:complete len:631 (-),score=58.46 TRINITY_DN100813_c0_g1_i1:933-2783(-)